MKLTLVIKNTAIFQGEYPSLAFVHLFKIMADLEPNKVLFINGILGYDTTNSRKQSLTFRVLLLNGLVHIVQLLLPLLRELLLPFLCLL
jgi:hypothetical protein